MSNFSEAQLHVKETVRSAVGELTLLAREAVNRDLPDVELANAWLTRVEFATKLLDALPVLDEMGRYRPLEWRLKRRRVKAGAEVHTGHPLDRKDDT